MKTLWRQTPLFIILSLLLIVLFSEQRQYIRSDGEGYYAYLPAIFIYQDLSYSFIDDILEKYPEINHHDFRKEFRGEPVNICFAGAALLWLPFFLLAHLLSFLLGLDADGYSSLYQYSILAAALAYLWLGLLSLQRLLKGLGFSAWQITLVLWLIVYSTPLFNYTCYDAGFTHVYSFALISAFSLHIYRYLDAPLARHIFWAALLLGLIVIIRPVNVLAFFAVPLFSGNWLRLKNFFSSVYSSFSMFWPAALILITVIAVQLLLWYAQTGYLFAWAYGDAGFNFSESNFFNALFSYRKGLFVYSPLLLLATFGFFPLFFKDKWLFGWMAFLVVMVIYVLSSWHSWWYGGSFGYRPMVDYLCFWGLLLAILFQGGGMIVRATTIALAILAVPFNLLQTYQYRHYILHHDQMNKEKYWDVFLVTDKQFSGFVWRKQDLLKSRQVMAKVTFRNDFDKVRDWDGNDKLTENPSFSGRSMLAGGQHPYSASLEVEKKAGEAALHALSFSAIAWLEDKNSNTQIVVAIDNNAGESRFWHGSYVYPYMRKTGEWLPLSVMLEMPALSNGERLRVFVWNPGKDLAYFDNIEVVLYTLSPETGGR